MTRDFTAVQTSPCLSILGVRVAQLTGDEALTRLEQLHDGRGPALVAYVNAHTLNTAYSDPTFRDLLNRAALVLNDGSGLALAARLQGARFPENLNGTDFTPRLLTRAAERGWPVFLLGGQPGVADAAAAKFQERIPSLKIAGTHSGFFQPQDLPALCQTIRQSGASLLLVAMGNPLQEKWLDANLAATGCKLGLGVGALFDFMAGRVSRAPRWMQRTGAEWIYRLVQEPGRMWRRYVLGNPRFVLRALLSGTRAPPR